MMAHPEIFISYDYDNDRHYKNLLMAWDSNDMFDFRFYDMSIDVSINSNDANYIKKVIRNRIWDASHFLCIVGQQTSQSDWVQWEIETAVAYEKPIIAVKINSSYSSPTRLLGVGASWARSFTFDAIVVAVKAS